MAYIGTPPANRPLTSFDIGENNITSFNISEAVIETLDIVNGSVTADKLAANAVTTSAISDNTITTAKLASNFAWGHGHPLSALSGNVSVEQLPLSGVTAGTYGNAVTIPTVTVNNKGIVTNVSNVAVTIPPGGFSNMVVFTSDTVWTIPAGITKIKATLVGGGGAGGSATYAVDGQGSAGVGSYLTSGTQTIDQIYAGPGIGGAPGGTTPQGAGGNATGGTLNIKGTPGLSSQVSGVPTSISGGYAVTFNSGEGGSSTLGGGMPPVFANNNGINATGINLSYGGGGSGGAMSGASGGGGQGGGGGSTAIKYLTDLTSGLTLTVDVGTGGLKSTTETYNGGNGGPGVVIIEY
jgi:hypothetical protein